METSAKVSGIAREPSYQDQSQKELLVRTGGTKTSMRNMENRRISYANLSYKKVQANFWLQLILSVCQQQHLCSFIQTCYLNRRKNLWVMSSGSIGEFVSVSQMRKWGRIFCAAEKDALEARCMQTGFFFHSFLLNSAKCSVHYKNCSWESSVLLLSGFCHSRKLWLWQAHSTHQWRMAMLCATHLSRTKDKLCFCFSFSRINHCSRASIVLNV